jgi:Protein of unknown function (DUF559)
MRRSSTLADRASMTSLREPPMSLNDLLAWQDGVLDTRSALAHLSGSALRWRLTSGRWQQPCRGVVVAHSGPLTRVQMLWIATLWAGPGAALAGLTAARLAGLHGFDDKADSVHLLLPAARTSRATRPPLRLVVHYSRYLTSTDIHPARQPAQTRIARSLVDAAAWMGTDRGAQAVLASGVQQRLVRVADLGAEVDRNLRLHRRRLMKSTLADIAGGSHALSELDFMRLVIRQFNLPVPDRQVPHRDQQGRRRWLDACWERARLVVEIDGAAHIDVFTYWDDMDRGNDLTLDHYRVMRFPAWMIRCNPGVVAAKIRQALREAGYPC